MVTDDAMAAVTRRAGSRLREEIPAMLIGATAFDGLGGAFFRSADGRTGAALAGTAAVVLWGVFTFGTAAYILDRM